MTSYTSPRVGPIRTNSYSTGPGSRDALADMLEGDEENPTLWQAVSYPSGGALDDFAVHWLRYDRQGTAAGIIDKLAGDTWQETPTIYDGDDTADDTDSDFEEQITALFSGDPLRRKPLHRFKVADRLGTLGQYSIIVIGFDDGRDLSTPVRGAVDDDADGEFNGLDDLNYVATFGQDRIIEPIEVDTDMRSERFRLPEMYEVITERGEDDDDDDDNTQEVHWSRVIHVPEGTLEDDLRGTPYLKNIFHNLINLDKILAGSGEGYWRGGYAGMVIRPPTDNQGKQLRFENDEHEQGGGSSELQNEINQYERNMKRVIATTGEVDTLAPNVADPEPHANQQYKEISVAKDIPQSVLMGNETGERATTEDSAMWKEHIASRRNNFAEPVILRPLVDRLISTGVLPTPDGDGYEVEWPPLDELSEQEEADVASTIADAISTLTGGQPDRIASRGELREVVGWDPTIGAESDVADDEQPDADDTDLDESDPAVMAAFDEQMGQFGDSAQGSDSPSEGVPAPPNDDD